MTEDKIALRELLEKGSDTTLLREMIGFAAQRLKELEADTLCGAGHGERSESRTIRCDAARIDSLLSPLYGQSGWHVRCAGAA